MTDWTPLPQATLFDEPTSIELVSSEVRVVVHPDCGMLISSFADLLSGAEALWVTGQPRRQEGNLGPGGAASTETFLELFVGGWFPMIPTVGFPAPEDQTAHLHGTAMRQPWVIARRSASALVATLKMGTGLLVTRALRVTGATLRVDTRLENTARSTVPVSWGEHPCLDLTTFESGEMIAAVLDARVPFPPLDAEAASLAAAETVVWPDAIGVDGVPRRVSDVGDPLWVGHDHVELELLGGRARVRAPRFGRVLDIAWDSLAWPNALLWRRFRGSAQADNVMAIEPASVRGRGASERDVLPVMEPGDQWDSWMSLSWSADDEIVRDDRV